MRFRSTDGERERERWREKGMVVLGEPDTREKPNRETRMPFVAEGRTSTCPDDL